MFLFLHFLSSQACKTHNNLQMRTKPNNHKNTNLLQNQSRTKNQTKISNKTTKPINPTTKPISNKVNLNLQTRKSSWEKKYKKSRSVELWERENESLIRIGLDTQRKNKTKPLKFLNLNKNIKCLPSFSLDLESMASIIKTLKICPLLCSSLVEGEPKRERAGFKDGPKHVPFF